MKYRCHGIEMRNVAVDVEADNMEDAATKAMELFESGDESVEESHGDPWYDEDIEIMQFSEEENDWDIAAGTTNVTVQRGLQS